MKFQVWATDLGGGEELAEYPKNEIDSHESY